jgi:hypothetical protein
MGTTASAPAAPKGAIVPDAQSSTGQGYGGVNSPFMSPSQVSNFLAPLPNSGAGSSMGPALGSTGSMPSAGGQVAGPAPTPWGMQPTSPGSSTYGIPQAPATNFGFPISPQVGGQVAGAAQQLGSAMKAQPIAGAAQNIAGALGQAQQQTAQPIADAAGRMAAAMPGAPMAHPAAMGGMYQRMAGLRR